MLPRDHNRQGVGDGGDAPPGGRVTCSKAWGALTPLVRQREAEILEYASISRGSWVPDEFLTGIREERHPHFPDREYQVSRQRVEGTWGILDLHCVPT